MWWACACVRARCMQYANVNISMQAYVVRECVCVCGVGGGLSWVPQ